MNSNVKKLLTKGYPHRTDPITELLSTPVNELNLTEVILIFQLTELILGKPG